MQEASAGMGRLATELAMLARDLPQEKQRMYEEIGEAVLQRVQGRIGGSGKVQGWQDAYIGSKHGYAAVRPKAKTYDAADVGKQRYAVGYVTNAIENGHRQEKGRYVAALGRRLKQERVSGRGFYAAAQREADQIAYEAAERFVSGLRKRMEG